MQIPADRSIFPEKGTPRHSGPGAVRPGDPHLLTIVQKGIEAIHRIELDVDIADFMADSATLRALAPNLPRSLSSFPSSDHLIAWQGDDHLFLAVHINEATLADLAVHNPFIQLTSNNFRNFCVVIEEVSHFVYITWKAGHDRPVTLLEMELQAEIDRYILLILMLQAQGRVVNLRRLKEYLFEEITLRPRLDEEQQNRYLAANRLALKYCHHLERHDLLGADKSDLFRELRQFYRASLQGKINRIQQAILRN